MNNEVTRALREMAKDTRQRRGNLSPEKSLYKTLTKKAQAHDDLAERCEKNGTNALQEAEQEIKGYLSLLESDYRGWIKLGDEFRAETVKYRIGVLKSATDVYANAPK